MEKVMVNHRCNQNCGFYQLHTQLKRHPKLAISRHWLFNFPSRPLVSFQKPLDRGLDRPWLERKVVV